MAEGHYSFEKVLEILQLEEDELKRLVSEGELRAFRDEDRMRFKRSDVDAMRGGRITEPTVLLPPARPAEESSEMILVEDETSETVAGALEIDFEFGDESSGEETVTETAPLELDSTEQAEPPRPAPPARRAPRPAVRPVPRPGSSRGVAIVAGLSFVVLFQAAAVALGVPSGVESPATDLATSVAGTFAPPAFVEDPGINPSGTPDGRVSEEERSWYRAWRRSPAP